MPIGNLTSQFFANIYLNGLDHFIKEKLRCRCYLRYMDDFVLFHNDKQFLWGAKRDIEKYLKSIRLKMHEGKCRIFKTEKGVPFLGLIVFPNRRRLKRTSIVKFKRRLKKLQILYKRGAIDGLCVMQSIRAWIGHAMHADTLHLRKMIMRDTVF